MKKMMIVGALCVLSVPALAQQAQDPAASAYSQLLAEANDRVVRLSAEISHDKAQIEGLEKQIAEANKAAMAKPTLPVAPLNRPQAKPPMPVAKP